jgi:hypothetical protein
LGQEGKKLGLSMGNQVKNPFQAIKIDFLNQKEALLF